LVSILNRSSYFNVLWTSQALARNTNQKRLTTHSLASARVISSLCLCMSISLTSTLLLLFACVKRLLRSVLMRLSFWDMVLTVNYLRNMHKGAFIEWADLPIT
jgi:hypothetical protein